MLELKSWLIPNFRTLLFSFKEEKEVGNSLFKFSFCFYSWNDFVLTLGKLVIPGELNRFSQGFPSEEGAQVLPQRSTDSEAKTLVIAILCITTIFF